MVYIKFTNGSTTVLVNMNNRAAQEEAIENGFYMDIDEDGSPEVMESSQLVNNTDESQSAILAQIADKLKNKNETNKRIKKTK